MPVLAFPLWRARGPRFLLLLLLLWVLMRLASQFPSTIDPAPPILPFAPPPELARREDPVLPVQITAEVRALRQVSPPAATRPARLDLVKWAETAPAIVPTGYSGDERHAWRLALLQRIGARPATVAGALALPQRPRNFAPGLAAPVPVPRWPGAAPGQRWSLSVASYWRGNDGTLAVGPDSAARLGGSQSAARLTYLVDQSRLLRAYVRAAHTPGRRDGFDMAVGVAVRPFKGLPVDVHAERRTVVAGAGRDTTLVYAAGGVDNRPLPLDFRLSAYAQAGVADHGATVGFADGAVAVQREVAAARGMRLSLGTMLGGAVQPGARRIDAGPRATLVLPDVGQGAQIALDWRERVAGNARPGSGLALTLAAEF